jgi:hypothetical protein
VSPKPQNFISVLWHGTLCQYPIWQNLVLDDGQVRDLLVLKARNHTWWHTRAFLLKKSLQCHPNYFNVFSVIIIYSFPSMPLILNFNPLNVITVSLKLTSLVSFKAKPPMSSKYIPIPSMPLEIGLIYLYFKNFRIKEYRPKFTLYFLKPQNYSDILVRSICFLIILKKYKKLNRSNRYKTNNHIVF